MLCKELRLKKEKKFLFSIIPRVLPIQEEEVESAEEMCPLLRRWEFYHFEKMLGKLNIPEKHRELHKNYTQKPDMKENFFAYSSKKEQKLPF
jgi:hypothetical protein